jgi:hypothetical protein
MFKLKIYIIVALLNMYTLLLQKIGYNFLSSIFYFMKNMVCGVFEKIQYIFSEPVVSVPGIRHNKYIACINNNVLFY